uniref:Uncharacterized protein n=1 Tax=Arion vulgaris TaxID=1028688 RepID=A0A0B6Z676_9EUPU
MISSISSLLPSTSLVKRLVQYIDVVHHLTTNPQENQNMKNSGQTIVNEHTLIISERFVTELY